MSSELVSERLAHSLGRRVEHCSDSCVNRSIKVFVSWVVGAQVRWVVLVLVILRCNSELSPSACLMVRDLLKTLQVIQFVRVLFVKRC